MGDARETQPLFSTAAVLLSGMGRMTDAARAVLGSMVVFAVEAATPATTSRSAAASAHAGRITEY